MATELARCVAEGRPYRLLDLKLYLTRRCNLRCLMCNAWIQDGDGCDELGTGEIFRLIAEARALGLANLKLFGGEPLLRRDLEALVAHAAGLGIRCTLITNGTLLYLYGSTERHLENAAQGWYVSRLQVGCCFKPWYYAVIRENGDVVGCNTVKHPLARIGNVREAPLDHLWHSAVYRAFRARCRPPQFDDCRRCCYHFALLNKQVENALDLKGSQALSGLHTRAAAFSAPGAN